MRVLIEYVTRGLARLIAVDVLEPAEPLYGSTKLIYRPLCKCFCALLVWIQESHVGLYTTYRHKDDTCTTSARSEIVSVKEVGVCNARCQARSKGDRLV